MTGAFNSSASKYGDGVTGDLGVAISGGINGPGEQLAERLATMRRPSWDYDGGAAMEREGGRCDNGWGRTLNGACSRVTWDGWLVVGGLRMAQAVTLIFCLAGGFYEFIRFFILKNIKN